MDLRNDLSGGGAPDSPPDPNLILVLNLLLFGCAGYIVLGERARAAIAGIAWFLGLASCGVISGIVAAIAAYDGYRLAKRKVLSSEF